MRRSTVSVAIATFNRRTMVRQAIDAALNQTHPPREVCVADDASTDGTGSLLDAFCQNEPKLSVLHQPSNTGGVENWNAAIRMTTGEYIAWCSDDDRFLPDHLAASVRFLDDHPEIGLVHSSFVDVIESDEGCFQEPRSLRFRRPVMLDRNSLVTYMLRFYDWPFHPSTIVMRRRVWDTVGGFDPRFALADTDWFLRAVEAFPIAMLARHGVLNRRHPGNWSNQLGSARMQREIRLMVENCIERLYPNDPLTRFAWKQIWGGNVRLRLLLTMAARIRAGQSDAACLAWRDAIGDLLPPFVESAGDRLVRYLSSHTPLRPQHARERVSPL